MLEVVLGPVLKSSRAVSLLRTATRLHSSYTATSQPLDAVAYDFRSDTVTVPTPDMLQHMAAAPTGDDVFKEDPSVNSLEHYVATLLGKPAALFVTSGTLANQLAIQSHLAMNGGGPPHSILVDSRSHVYLWEAGGVSAHAGAQVIPIHAKTHGHLTASDIKTNYVPMDDHCAPSRLVCLENTLNGVIMPADEIAKIASTSHRLGMSVHMDGARLWNVSAATGVPLANLAEPLDSVSVCFSKGIGAPIGSVLAGSGALIARARHLRKMHGGGWRQAGILAACAQFAIDRTYPNELVRTHWEARRLADGLVARGARLANPVDTNMVFVDWAPLGWSCDSVLGASIRDASRSEHSHVAPVRVFGGNSTVMRLVLHYQLAPNAVDRFLGLVDQLLSHP